MDQIWCLACGFGCGVLASNSTLEGGEEIFYHIAGAFKGNMLNASGSVIMSQEVNYKSALLVSKRL
jgi:hypothetical protein